MFARMLRCVMTTPLGSAVAPEVKMISTVSSGLRSGRGSLVAVREPLLCDPFSASAQIGRGPPARDEASTTSPTRIARASTMSATLARNASDAR